MAASVECNLREQHALDTAGVGIVFIRQRVIVRCNRRCADIFGYPDEHALVGVGSEQLHPSRGDLRSLGREAYTTLSAGHAYRTQRRLLIRPCEVLSRVANVTILEVANNALRVLLQHRHVIIGSLA